MLEVDFRVDVLNEVVKRETLLEGEDGQMLLPLFLVRWVAAVAGFGRIQKKEPHPKVEFRMG